MTLGLLLALASALATNVAFLFKQVAAFDAAAVGLWLLLRRECFPRVVPRRVAGT